MLRKIEASSWKSPRGSCSPHREEYFPWFSVKKERCVRREKIWQLWRQGGCCVCCDGRYIGFWWMVCVLLDGGSMNGSVAGHRPPDAHNPVVCGAFCVFVSILLLYFCTYLGFVQGRRPPAHARRSCLWCVFYTTIVLLYVPLFCARSPAAGDCTSKLFVVRFWGLCLSNYATFVHTPFSMSFV